MTRRLRHLVSHLLSPSVSGTSLTRDTRVGLALAAAFLVAFGFVLLRRLRMEPPRPAMATASATAQSQGGKPAAHPDGEVAVVERAHPTSPSAPAPASLPLASVPPEVLDQILPQAASDAEAELIAEAGHNPAQNTDPIEDLPGELVLTTEPATDRPAQPQTDVTGVPGPEAADPQLVVSEAIPPPQGSGPTEAGVAGETSSPEIATDTAQSTALAQPTPQVAAGDTDESSGPEPNVVAPTLEVALSKPQPAQVQDTEAGSTTDLSVDTVSAEDTAPAATTEMPMPAAVASSGPDAQTDDSTTAVEDGNPQPDLVLVGPDDPNAVGAATPQDAADGTTALLSAATVGENIPSGPASNPVGSDEAVPPGERPATVPQGASGHPGLVISPAVEADDAAERAAQRPADPAVLLAAESSPKNQTGAISAPQAEAEAAYRTYRVRPGDSLWTIARRVLGAGARWREIYQLNRDVLKSPHRLRPGIVLKLPMDTKEVVQQPGADTTRVR